MLEDIAYKQGHIRLVGLQLAARIDRVIPSKGRTFSVQSNDLIGIKKGLNRFGEVVKTVFRSRCAGP